MTEEERKAQIAMLSLLPGEYLEMRYERFTPGAESPVPEGFIKAGMLLPRPGFYVRLIYRVAGARSPIGGSPEQG